MIWDGFDKRKFPRLNLRCEIIIQSDATAAPIQAVTENVGVGGVSVILEQPLERFSQCHVRLEIDPALPCVEGKGKVVWTIPTREIHSRKKTYDTGIEFMDVSNDHHDLLKKFIQEHMSPKGFREI